MIATVVSSGNKYSSPTLVIVDAMDARAISPVFFPQNDPILVLRVSELVPDSSVVNGNNNE